MYLTNTTQDIKYPNVLDHNKNKTTSVKWANSVCATANMLLVYWKWSSWHKNGTNFSLVSFNGLEMQHLNKNPCLKKKKRF